MEVDRSMTSPRGKYKQGLGFTMALSSKTSTLETLPPIASNKMPLMRSVTLGNSSDLESKHNDGAPKKGDENKSVVVQSFTHRKIIDIGDDIHRKTLETKDMECESAVREAEAKIWAQAEVMKHDAVEKTKARMKFEHEKAIKKFLKEQEKLIKEEALRVEAQMSHIVFEEVEKERMEGERKLAETVKRLEEKFKKENFEAVNKVRREERDRAAKDAANVARINKETMERTVKQAEETKQRALTELSETKNWEKQDAVTRVRAYEQQVALNNLRVQKQNHDTEIEKLNGIVQELKKDIEIKQEECEKLESEKAGTERQFVRIREGFMDYINKVNKFEPGEGEYLMPFSTPDESFNDDREL